MAIFPKEIRNIDYRFANQVYAVALECFPDRLFSEKTIFAYLSDCQFKSYGAFFESKLIGFITVLPIKNESDIILVATKKDYRTLGVARALALVSIQKLELNTVFAEVDATDIVALKFYEALGFEKTQLRKNYITTKSGEKADAWLLKLII
jgi:ribosomal-protein-alanine N-acetyltransferase